MQIFHLIGILITLAALFAYLNHRFLRLPMTVGLMLQSLILSALLIFLSLLGIDIETPARHLVEQIRFNEFLLEVVLSFLLFAGALFVDVNRLKDAKLDIALLVLAGVTLSTVLVGFALYGLSLWLGMGLRLIYCLIFGALISPTDPVAVLATLKRLGIDKHLEARLTGEALFNDGVGIVLFLSLSRLAVGGDDAGFGSIVLLFIREGFGGLAFGGLVGFGGYLLLRRLDSYPIEILITLAMVSGGYTLAHYIQVSGPLAMVVAGLMIGSHGRTLAMSEITERNLSNFWEVVETVLNALLFTLIGLEILVLLPALGHVHLLAGAVAIPVVLLARFLSVSGISLAIQPLGLGILPRSSIPLLTWGGVRGGISIALALAIASAPERRILVVATYMVAVFSLLVQATTVGRLARRRMGRPVKTPTPE